MPTALVKLKDDLVGYTISNVHISVKGGGHSDVSAKRVNDTSWEIDDTGADIEEGRFDVKVNAPGGGAPLGCDPIWRND